MESTPLQRRLDQLGRWLVAGCLLVVAVLVFAIGVIEGVPSLSDVSHRRGASGAAIPEGLPAAVTIAHAVGVQPDGAGEMLLYAGLPAVETLGCATVICSRPNRKTLTQNIMTCAGNPYRRRVVTK